MWPPETPPELLPGRSALFWLKAEGVCIVTGMVSVALIVVSRLLLAPPLRESVMFGSLIVSLAVGGVGISIAWLYQSALDRECDSGYTTLFGTHLELWQLDDRTGEVLRRPGEREVRRRRRGDA